MLVATALRLVMLILILPVITYMQYELIFRRVRIAAKSAHYLCHVRLSASISTAPTGRISVKFNVGVFYESLSSTSKFG
jgi:hypothetical protein